MENIEQKLVIERYNQCKEERMKYVPRWKEIEQYISITSDIDSNFEQTKYNSDTNDILINDTTAFSCVNNAGDYLAGILWSPEIVTIEPSEYIKETGNNFEKFFSKVTDKFKAQMNHSDAGFSTILRSYCYDQYSYASSGIGAFRSKKFDNNQSTCCIDLKNYNVQTSCIDEGASNKVDVIFTVYNWRLNRIIEEFCMTDGIFDKTLFSEMPEKIKRAYESDKFNEKFKLVNGILPNSIYKLNTRGIKGAQYKGYWFLEGDSKIFKEEYFKVLPIAFCRAIRLSNQIYGESAGTIALSNVKMLNYITGVSVDNIEKNTDSPLGVLSGALLSGEVLDRSANAVNVFNPQAVKDGSPIFPIGTTGDISGLINYLIPLLKKDITNIFKLDQLLDFNNQTQMSATESSYRMSIRGKSIAGLISQQKTELLEPLIHRAISIMQDCNIFGYSLEDLKADETLENRDSLIENEEFIPDEIYQAMKDNKQWYKIAYHGELERLSNNELYEALSRFMQFLQFAISIDKNILGAIDTYEFLSFCQTISNLTNQKFLKTKQEYQEMLEQIQQFQQQQLQEQQKLNDAKALSDVSNANKNNAQATQGLSLEDLFSGDNDDNSNDYGNYEDYGDYEDV